MTDSALSDVPKASEGKGVYSHKKKKKEIWTKVTSAIGILIPEM